MLIRGTAVELVPLARQHLESTMRWANDPELMRLLGRTRTVTVDEHQRWFAALASADDRLYMAILDVVTGDHIGNAWLWSIDEQDRKAELRIVIGEPGGAGRGAGSEAIALLSEHAFRSLDLHRVYAFVFAFNPRARRAFEKAGFTVEGLLRGDRWSEGGPVDTYLLARLRTEAVPS